MLQVACVSTDPRKRPAAAEVVRLLMGLPASRRPQPAAGAAAAAAAGTGELPRTPSAAALSLPGPATPPRGSLEEEAQQVAQQDEQQQGQQQGQQLGEQQQGQQQGERGDLGQQDDPQQGQQRQAVGSDSGPAVGQAVAASASETALADEVEAEVQAEGRSLPVPVADQAAPSAAAATGAASPSAAAAAAAAAVAAGTLPSLTSQDLEGAPSLPSWLGDSLTLSPASTLSPNAISLTMPEGESSLSTGGRPPPGRGAAPSGGHACAEPPGD